MNQNDKEIAVQIGYVQTRTLWYRGKLTQTLIVILYVTKLDCTSIIYTSAKLKRNRYEARCHIEPRNLFLYVVFSVVYNKIDVSEDNILLFFKRFFHCMRTDRLFIKFLYCNICQFLTNDNFRVRFFEQEDIFLMYCLFKKMAELVLRTSQRPIKTLTVKTQLNKVIQRLLNRYVQKTLLKTIKKLKKFGLYRNLILKVLGIMKTSTLSTRSLKIPVTLTTHFPFSLCIHNLGNLKKAIQQ